MFLKMPKFVKTHHFSDDEWNMISVLLTPDGYLKPHKSYHMLVDNPTKQSVIAEDVLIKLLDYLYFNKNYITPAIFCSDQWWNQIETKKQLFSLSDHIEITLLSHQIVYKLLQQLHQRETN